MSLFGTAILAANEMCPSESISAVRFRIQYSTNFIVNFPWELFRDNNNDNNNDDNNNKNDVKNNFI